MNGEEVMLGDFDPEWVEDGLSLTGEQIEPDFSEASHQWDTNCWSEVNAEPDDFIGTGC